MDARHVYTISILVIVVQDELEELNISPASVWLSTINVPLKVISGISSVMATEKDIGCINLLLKLSRALGASPSSFGSIFKITGNQSGPDCNDFCPYLLVSINSAVVAAKT